MSLQFADTVILGEICYDMKLCTQWKKKLTHDRHNFKLTGWNENNKKEKYSVHKQQIISIYINYTTEKKSLFTCNKWSHRLSPLIITELWVYFAVDDMKNVDPEEDIVTSMM